MAITTTADLNGLYNEIYERSIFIAREMNLMLNLVSQYSATNFFTRHLTVRPQLVITNATEGVDYVNAQTFGKSEIGTLTPGVKMGQYIVTDIEIMNDADGTMQDASQEIGAAMAAKIDTDLVGVFSQFSTDKGTGAGQAATIASVAAAVSLLRTRFAPQDGPINVVLHPYAWHDIWVLLGQPVATAALLGDVANQALKDYFVGNWLGVRWFTSANISTDANADAVSGVFTQSAIAFDSRIAPYMELERDASLMATEANMVAGYAVGLGKRPTYGVKYTCDVTEPT
jgi:hypothetical protein